MPNYIPEETDVYREEKFQKARQGADFQSRNIKYKGTPGEKRGSIKEANL